MMHVINRQVRLVARPTDIPQAEHFALSESALPDLQDGEFLVRNRFLSVEPAMRGWVSVVGNYAKPVGLGEVMRSFAAGAVVASRHPDFTVGDQVMGMLGWQDYAVAKPAQITRKVRETDLPLSASLGVLGLTGTTAYLALLGIGQPREGDVVVVSTAAGSVGSCVGQIAKIKGCRTIGIAGGAEKVRMCLEQFGYDAALDYKSADFMERLGQALPNGANVYFDNTAGRITDAVLPLLAPRARVVVCGTASISSWDPWPVGPRAERHLLVKRARMEGFLLFDHADRIEEAVSALAGWIRSGDLRYSEHVLDGIDQAPGAIARLYRGENMGKLLIRLAD